MVDDFVSPLHDRVDRDFSLKVQVVCEITIWISISPAAEYWISSILFESVTRAFIAIIYSILPAVLLTSDLYHVAIF